LEDAGCVEPTLSVSVEIEQRVFHSADDVVLRITWDNPTTTDMMLDPKWFETNKWDVAWSRITFTSNPARYKSSDYQPYLLTIANKQIINWSTPSSVWRIPALSTTRVEVPILVFIDRNSLGDGAHVLDFSARFAYYQEVDFRRRLFALDKRGTLQFSIVAEK
jgi:hypothetical protein